MGIRRAGDRCFGELEFGLDNSLGAHFFEFLCRETEQVTEYFIIEGADFRACSNPRI